MKWGGLVYTGRSHQALDLTRSTSSRHSHGSGLHSSIDDPLAGAFRFSSFGVLYCSPVCGHEIGNMLIISDFDHPPERGHRTSRRVGEWRKEIPLFELLEPFPVIIRGPKLVATRKDEVAIVTSRKLGYIPWNTEPVDKNGQEARVCMYVCLIQKVVA